MEDECSAYSVSPVVYHLSSAISIRCHLEKVIGKRPLPATITSFAEVRYLLRNLHY